MRIGYAATLLLVSAGSALAEAPGPAEPQGLPQLNATFFPPQLVWLVISFVVLYRLMTKKGLPLVAEVLEERQAHIAGDLDKATAARDESQTVVAGYEQALAEARSNAQVLIAATVAEIAAANAARMAEVVAEINTRTADAETSIRTARDQAIAEIGHVAVGLARDAVTRLAEIDIDDATVDQAVAAALQEHG